MTNNWDLIEKNDLSKNALGGSELALRRLYDGFVPRDLLEKFQIIPSRVTDLKADKFRILWCQDLPGDPGVDLVLKNEGWRKFHYIVFVSHWQAQNFINYYHIPWSKTIVMLNAIKPLQLLEKQNDTINIIYHTTPHRGLNVLVTVFAELAKHQNVHLDIYSSFKIYGWPERDAEFKQIFDFCDQHEKITYHSSASNDEVRAAVEKAHIFAYPSIWQETSCMCLQEAMSAGLICVHSDLGALAETAANWTMMYHYDEDINRHANSFLGILEGAVNEAKNDNGNLTARLKSQKSYADVFYNWEIRKVQWQMFLEHVVKQNPPLSIEADLADQFVYRS